MEHWGHVSPPSWSLRTHTSLAIFSFPVYYTYVRFSAIYGILADFVNMLDWARWLRILPTPLTVL